MADRDAADLAIRLGRHAEAVCRAYLSNGRREGRYWLVGDVRNTPGGSMYVRLKGPETGRGAAGKWTDAATGEHGDLIDVIRESLGLAGFREAADEARRFLSLPRPEPAPSSASQRASPEPRGSSGAARRLLAISELLTGTLGETYLRGRGVTALHDLAALCFHPRCYYRAGEDTPLETWPAMIAAVTDLDGHVTGAHRTWLDPRGFSEEALGKAPITKPRRAMGDLLGHAVRFGAPSDVMAAGEGIETVLLLRCVLPGMAMAAALSANHLAAILFPPTLRRLYIVRDHDASGDGARDRLIERAGEDGIETVVLNPVLGDFNDDLRLLGADRLRATAKAQLAAGDARRYLQPPA